MSPGSSTESYPAFARIGLRENPRKNLNQVTCPDRDSNPGHLVSRPDALTNHDVGKRENPEENSRTYVVFSHPVSVLLDTILRSWPSKLRCLLCGKIRTGTGNRTQDLSALRAERSYQLSRAGTRSCIYDVYRLKCRQQGYKIILREGFGRRRGSCPGIAQLGNVPVFVHGLEIRLGLGLRPLLALHNHPIIISSGQRNSAFQALQPQKLEWVGHLIRMEDERMAKMILTGTLEGKRDRGRPRLRWLDCIEEDLRKVGIRRWRKRAEDRSDWGVVLKEALAKL
ncbi:hypothetical protein ANN_14752 [Periplaneta americana]|uniref:Uncharacterized protein n=1 Tax=Periplaneta americana TaxID=6978 RepID=A0ABQ8SYM4_PERAM|nr:hypothetical protein ANN_14752 [Periplaneta americana]